MRKIQFVPGEHYHIFNHGVDEKNVFINDFDFKRFLVCLVVFNDQKGSPRELSRFVKNPNLLLNKYSPDNRDRLVDIIAFTLLPTHYHLFVKEKAKNGISRFMHCLNKGYARHFNLKNNRRGALWQETFGAKHINSQAYFVHIFSYIHLNILDLYYPEWRTGKTKDWPSVAPKLISYPWSSYAYYRIGSSQIPFINLILTEPEWLGEYYPQREIFEKHLHSWSSRFLTFIE